MVEDSSLESGEYLVYMFNAKIDSALLFISGTTVCVLCIVLLLSEALYRFGFLSCKAITTTLWFTCREITE